MRLHLNTYSIRNFSQHVQAKLQTNIWSMAQLISVITYVKKVFRGLKMFKSLFQEVVRGLEMTATSSQCQQLSTVFSGGVSNFNQSEARKHCFLASGWLKFETSPENTALYRVRNYRGRVSNFDQSEARKQCFLASDWLKFVTLPR